VLALPPLVSERKLRLFACGCCRHVWEWLDSAAHDAVEVAERYADGLATEVERCNAMRVLVESSETGQEVQENCWVVPWLQTIEIAVLALASNADCLIGEDGRCIAEAEGDKSRHRVALCCRLALTIAEWQNRYDRNAKRGSIGRWCSRLLEVASLWVDDGLYRALKRKFRKEEIEHQLHLFADIFGNTSNPPLFSSGWRTDTAVSLANQMYESRDFGAMPILADALQDVGCEDEAILHHCRDANQVHVRGCWVVDLVLGKE
jgi:hypothetical protein